MTKLARRLASTVAARRAGRYSRLSAAPPRACVLRAISRR